MRCYLWISFFFFFFFCLIRFHFPCLLYFHFNVWSFSSYGLNHRFDFLTHSFCGTDRPDRQTDKREKEIKQMKIMKCHTWRDYATKYAKLMRKILWTLLIWSRFVWEVYFQWWKFFGWTYGFASKKSQTFYDTRSILRTTP